MNVAIITGASSGIGREFCLQIDKLNLDQIWGIGLGKEGLEETGKALKTPFEALELDLTEENSFAILQEKLSSQKPNVCWLVNASGYGKFGRYDEYSTDEKVNMIDLNCSGVVRMTESVLPFMGKGGVIVQVASVAAFQPTPYVGVYAATKAFVLSYARSLNEELRSRQISVTALCPFWTKTAFFDRAKKITSSKEREVITKYTVMYDPKWVVEKAMKGARKGKEVVIPGFVAKSQAFMVKLLPHKWIKRIWCRQQKFKQRYSD